MAFLIRTGSQSQISSVPVMDQFNNTGSPTIIIAWTTGWQSITAGMTGKFTGIKLMQYNSATVRTFNVYAGEGNTGTLLYTETIGAGGVNRSWRLFNFTNGPNIQSGNIYTVEWTASVNVGIYIKSSGGYDRGRANIDPGYDYVFETYVLV